MSPPIPCSIITCGRGPGDEERALGHHVVLQVPVGHGGLQQRLGDRQPGVVDDQVDPAEREHGRVERGRRPRPRRRRRRRPRSRRRRCRSRAATAAAFAASRSATTTQAPSAASRTAIALPIPDAAPVTSATRVASGFGCGHPGELGLFQRPVLDAELLRLGDRGVARHRLGAAHHVDRVDVELARHPGGLLVARRRRTCPTPGTSTMAGSAPRIGGESGSACRS